MRISKTVSNTNAQHAFIRAVVHNPGSRTGTGPRNYKINTAGDTTRFLGMWLVDSSHGNTVARALSGCGKFVKRWPVRGYKRVGDHCFSGYLFKHLL